MSSSIIFALKFLFVITFTCANFESNPVLLTYLLSISEIFVSKSLSLIKVLISGTVLLRLVSSVFVAGLLISGILFSTAVNEVFIANPLTAILFSTVVNAVFIAKLLISGILPSISVILAL